MKFAEAFVEFSTKGIPEVEAQAERLMAKIRGMSGRVVVDLSPTGQTQAAAAADQIKAKLDKVNEAAKVKFKPDGIKEMEAQIDALRKRAVDLSAAGRGDPSKAAGDRTAEVLADAGEGAGRAFGNVLMNFFGGGMGAGFGMGIAAAIAAAFTKLPGMIGEQVDLYRDAAVPRQRSLSESEAKQWNNVISASRYFWSQSQADINSVDAIARAFIGTLPDNAGPERVGQHARKAEEFINRAMTLRAGGGLDIEGFGSLATPDGMKSMAMAYAVMLQERTPAAKNRFASIPAIQKALAEHFNRAPERVMEAVGLRDWQRGAIKVEDIEKAFTAVATGQRMRQGATEQLKQYRISSGQERGGAAWSGENQLSYNELDYLRRTGKPAAGTAWLHASQESRRAEWAKRLGISPERAQQLNSIQSAEELGNLSLLPGMGGQDWAKHSIAGPRDYQFTSLAGLAEVMQQQASGILNDVAEQQLSELRAIRENTAKDGTHGGGIKASPTDPGTNS